MWKAYIENTANLGLFAVHKVVSEYADKIYAQMERMPRDKKTGDFLVYNRLT
jgi:hypothetical protein